MQDFKSLTEVLRHNEETLVIDLLQHALCLDEQLLKALVDPPEGIYLLGSIDPILKANEQYYYQHQVISECPVSIKSSRNSGHVLNLNGSVPIHDLKIVTKHADDILDKTGRIILTAKDIRAKGKFFRTEPTVPSMAIKMAIGVVQRYLSTLCKYTSHIGRYAPLYSYVKEEHHDLVDKDEYFIAFDHLLNQVMKFVKNDHWNIYSYDLLGTNLILTKGVDWRIYDWYRIKFEAEGDHDQES